MTPWTTSSLSPLIVLVRPRSPSFIIGTDAARLQAPGLKSGGGRTVVAPEPRNAFFVWTLDAAAQDPESLLEEKKEKRYARTNWH